LAASGCFYSKQAINARYAIGERKYQRDEMVHSMSATIFRQSGRLRRRVLGRAFSLTILLSFAGCALDPNNPDGALKSANVERRGEEQVLVGTTRNRTDQPSVYFGTERVAKLDFAEMVVAPPSARKTGATEIALAPPGDPGGGFPIRNGDYLADENAFLLKLNAALHRLQPGNRHILLYIHGFNTRFNDAVSRAAQLSYDVKLPNVPVVFSWASRGNVFDYPYDNNSAMAARGELGRFLRLVERSDADKIDVVAHSLGNMLLVESLIQLKLRGITPQKNKIGLIFLAAPDIDYDVFKAQLVQLGRPEVPYYILLSKDDQALSVSSLIAGSRPRLGDFSNPQELTSLGATVIDATDIAAQDPAHHDKYSQIAQIAPQLIHAFGQPSPKYSMSGVISSTSITVGGQGGVTIPIYTVR
jgi:esterase/lipase superfamily enzyme